MRSNSDAAPAVVSLNATVAATATNEFTVFVSGLRPVSPYVELDLLGVGRPVKSQWMKPRSVKIRPGGVQRSLVGIGDEAAFERYANSATPLGVTD